MNKVRKSSQSPRRWSPVATLARRAREINAADERRGDAGDTLLEILIALLILAVATVSILVALLSSVSGSAEYRTLATIDTMLRSAAGEVTAQVAQAPAASWANCTSTSQPYVSLTSVSGYTYSTSAPEYWNGTTYSTACTANASILLTISITHLGQTYSISTVLYDPQTRPQPTTYAASQLVYLGEPSNGTAGVALSPSPIIAVEDRYGNIVTSDASPVEIAITSGSGTSGAALSSNCTGTAYYGVVTFTNCSINLPGAGYTLTATDGSSVASNTSSPFTVGASPLQPAQLSITTPSQSGAPSSGATLGPITIQELNSAGVPVVAPTGGTLVVLSSSSLTGVFALTSGGTAISSATIPAGSNSVSLYYGDPTFGTPTLTASSPSLTSTTQIEDIFSPTPVATISFPVTSTFYNATSWTNASSITGKAAETGSPPNSVVLTIENTTTSTYWNGTIWVSGATTVAATGSYSWSYAFSNTNLQNGDAYSVVATATDAALKTNTSSVITFSYVTTVPTVAITFPTIGSFYNATGWTASTAISGTASAVNNPMSSVMVQIEDATTTQWWTGSTWSSTQTSVPATGTTSWSYVLSNAHLINGDSYALVATATDVAGNTNTATSSFGFDTSAPGSTVTFPSTGSFYNGTSWTGATMLAGTASDSFSGVTSVVLTIKNVTTNQYFNGVAFASPMTTVPANGTSSWNYPMSSSLLVNGDSYTLLVTTTDNAGNTNVATAVTFGFDTTAPNVSVTTPVNGSFYDATSWTTATKITGTASDTFSGLSSVAVLIENTTTSQWWNGTTWVSTLTWVAASGTTSWTYPLSSAVLLTGDAYSVMAQATDTAGNVGMSTLTTFGYETTSPTTVFTFPTSGGFYNASGWTTSTLISGTTTESFSGLASVTISIYNSTTTKYWNGSTWVTGAIALPVVGSSSWTYAFSSASLVNADSYTVALTATNGAGDVSVKTSSFEYVTTPPSVAITFPTSGGYYNAARWTASTNIAGTAADANDPISGVTLVIENTTLTQWWSGSSWSGTPVSVPAIGTSAWTYQLSNANLVNGDSYSVVATATDDAGNTTTSSTSTFSYFTSPPSVALTFPISGTYYNATGWTTSTAISGTASASGDPLSSVTLLIENTTTAQYWNGSIWTTTPTSVTAIGVATWSYVLSDVHLLSGDAYTVIATATDAAGNSSSTLADSFGYDTTPPSVAVTAPLSGQYFNASSWNGISGTASGSGSPLASLSVVIEDTTTTQWWNGTGWTGTSTSIPLSVSTAWSYGLPSAALTDGNSYSVTPTAIDSANNSSTGTTVTFGYDLTPPVVGVTFPGNNKFYNATGWTTSTSLSGTSSDSFSGVAAVTVSIQNLTTGLWWNGTGWTGTATSVTATGTTSWTYGLSNTHLTSGDQYSVTATATDKAGNITTSTASTFGYDTGTPAVTITFPTTGSYYNGAGWTTSTSITGTSSDGFSGVAAVTITVKDSTTNTYWNGTTWTATTVSLPVTGLASWSYTLSSAALSNANSYIVTATATDNAGNASTVTSTFGYDIVAPSSATVVFPVSGSYYGPTTWTPTTNISGTSADASSGVANVDLTIENVTTGLYWNGSAWTNGPLSVLASGTTSWTYALSNATLTAADTYSVAATATDRAGNSFTGSAVTFYYDDVAPNLAISFPTLPYYSSVSWTTSSKISGTASGNGDPLSKVTLTIKNATGNTYWSGTAWTLSPTTLNATGTTSWTYALSSANLTSGDSYVVTVTATDDAANTSVATASFAYDTSAPTQTLTFPTSSFYGPVTWTGASSISGTAADVTSGVSSVQVVIKNTTAGTYWNGSSWGATSTSLPATGTTSWTYAFSSTNFLSGDAYSVSVTATNGAGLTSIATTDTFSYYSTAPTVAITFPVLSTHYTSTTWQSTTSITGTAAATGDTISNVSLVIENTSTKQFWTGSGWTAGNTPTSVTATGTTSWTYAFSNANFTVANDSYSIIATATDAAGNQTSTSALTFVYR